MSVTERGKWRLLNIGRGYRTKKGLGTTELVEDYQFITSLT